LSETPRAFSYSRKGACGLSLLFGLASGLLSGNSPLVAQAESVIDTVHNLSVSGPGSIRAVSETEVCKFCHIPHNAMVPSPLWGHTLSGATYQVPEIKTTGASRGLAPQPDGSSRLCLSCHDGTVALGDVAGEPREIPMVGGGRLVAGQKGFLGTDLSGSHPISFVVPAGDAATVGDATDMGLRPLSMIAADGDVRLDAAGKIQCTTCHDPHSDRFYREGSVPRFWVKPSIDEVCLTCHALR